MQGQSGKPKHIVVVGGGTAGWMSALLMAHSWRERGIDITLLESATIPTVGVGEGSTPALKKFFDYLGVDETEWMPACYATYKTGIEFRGWSGQANYPEYFHAFDSALDLHTEPAFFFNCDMKRKGVALDTHPAHYYINGHLAAEGRLPTPAPHFPFDTGYGYHFDAKHLAAYLGKLALTFGVRHRFGSVVDVLRDASGNIAQLGCESGETIAADFFIDCTGFAAILMEKCLAEPFISYADSLLNDRAVTLACAPTDAPKPKTIATALSAGWLWQIPLVNRTGQGYVYSSAFISDADAELELRRNVHGIMADTPVQRIKMRVGRRRNHWVRNCLAVGLSQGFVEPLEATALNLVQTTVQQFIDAFELGGFSNVNCTRFNDRINSHFDGVKDYIVAHYVSSQRCDTPYWRAARAVVNSEPLKLMMKAWVTGVDLGEVMKAYELDKFYTKMSWYSLLAGYGLYLPNEKLGLPSAKANRYPVQKTVDFLAVCAKNYPLVARNI